MDYTSLFGDQTFNTAAELTPTATAPSSPTPAPSTGTDWGKLFTNPAMQTAALQFAIALDPNGFGGRLAKGLLPMRQGMSQAEANKGAVAPTQVAGLPQMPGQQTALPPATPPEQQPAILSDNHVKEPMAVADQFNKMGSMIKAAAGFNPTFITPEFKQGLDAALFAEPVAIQNPTQPTGSNTTAGQPVGATNVGQSFSIDPAVAASMTPEQVNAAFALNTDARKQGLAEALMPSEVALRTAQTAHMNWEMDPERVAEHIKISTAPVLAQIEVAKQKGLFDLKMADDFVAANPDVAGIQLPGGMTVGQQLRMAATNPEAARNVAGLVNAGLDYKAAQIRAAAEIEATKLRMKLAGQEQTFQKNMLLYEKFNQDVLRYGKSTPLADWNKLSPKDQEYRRLLGEVPRTPEIEQALQNAIKMRDSFGALLMPESYKGLVESENKVGTATGTGANKIVVPANDPKLIEIDRKTKRTGPRFDIDPVKEIMNMFSPKEAEAGEYDPALVSAVISVESAGKTNAKSKKGAQGLMQLMPATAKEVGVKNPLNPRENIKGGITYLNKLLARYKGNTHLALAAYNWGPTNVDRVGWAGVPREVKDYVAKVIAKRNRYHMGL